MVSSDLLKKAFHLFDTANAKDPNKETVEGKQYPKELLYAERMTAKLNDFAPDASEALRLTARCQHICRWEIPRDSYAMNREGYLRWRLDLKKFHVEKAGGILKEAGYGAETIGEVSFLLAKKQLKKNEDTQTLEDVICLVFLAYYFEPFAEKHPDDKTIAILQKTWRKMSEKGQQAVLALPLSERAAHLVKQALNG